MDSKLLLKNRLEELKISDINSKIKKLVDYMDGIIYWNEKVNLTNITDKNEFLEKHFIDSLSVCDESEFLESVEIIDVGTGGGFPGIPLAICYPEKKFTLLDSLNKRLKIIKELCDKLNISNVKVLHGRAEDIGQNSSYRESFDLCLSRAVANLSSLSELCIPLIKQEKYFIAYKGPNLDSELEEAKKAITTLGGRVEEIVDKNILGRKHRILKIKKKEITDNKYPRKAGIPIKKPLK